MKDFPLVSFCLFTYNQEKYIEEAIDGAFSQDYSNLEIIISDDCSTDGTWSIIERKVKQYSGQHRIITNRNDMNLGLAGHVNKLYYDLSKGEYVAIAAGDDISLPQRISKSIEFLEKNTEVVALSTSMQIINSGSYINNVNKRWIRKKRVFTVDDYLEVDFEHISGASRIISRRLIEVFPKLNIDCPTEDATFLFRAFLIGKVAEIEFVGVRYRIHDKNVSSQINKKEVTVNAIIKQHKSDLEFKSDIENFSLQIRKKFENKLKLDKKKRLLKNKLSLIKTRKTKEKKITQKLSKKFKTPKLKVYSHPRSGTHFLEAFLAKNFYQKEDLSLDKITWGHWSNRMIKDDGNPYGKLFGHHFFPSNKNFKSPGIYIIRDGRAVAYSIWKTPNFLHKDIDSSIPFSEFLKTPLDWSGSPSNKTNERLTIFEHWAKHCDDWIKFSQAQKGLLIINYEDLVNNPHQVYLKIKRFNFKFKRKLSASKLDTISKPTGLLPNQAKVNSWYEKFTQDDLELFDSVINNYDFLKSRYK